MELNEALVKVDHTLENTVKKIEKIALEADLTKQQKAFVEHQNKKITPFDYLKTFAWDQKKYNSSRTMVEIAGTISDQMKKIDSDLKKQQDEINELRNQHSALAKLDGNNFTTQDISKAIYTADNLNPRDIFIES